MNWTPIIESGQGKERLTELLPIGAYAVFTKAISETLIRDFGNMTGDFDPIHSDTQFAQSSRYGRIIAHGSLIVAFMSSAATVLTEKFNVPVFSLGYDRLRFLYPVFPGDEVCVTITVTGHSPVKMRILANVSATVRDKLVAVATNVMVVDCPTTCGE